MFEGLANRISRLFSGSADGEVIRKTELRDRMFEALVESDVSVDLAEKISDSILMKAEKLKGKISVNQMQIMIRRELIEILTASGRAPDILSVKKRPYVILFLGVNGGGKTTTIAKLASYIKKSGFRAVLSASDTFRAGAIEQLSTWSSRTGIEIIKHEQGSDPSAVAFDAINHAIARKLDFVLIDTAGRMQNNKNLIEEMKKIKRVAKPDLTLLILDAMIGQDAVEQGRTFLEHVGLDGLIVTKLDTDARGGLLISLVSEIGKPVYFVCTGQDLDDIMPFDPQWYADKILPLSSNT